MREIKFDDDTFALNKKRVIALCDEIIRRGYHKKIVWNCFGHITQSDEELYKWMMEAGCVRVNFGMESGSQKILDMIKKKIDVEKAKETISICKKLGIETYCTFMIGFPHETEEDIKQSIDAAIQLDPDFIQVSYVVPYPGTQMYNEGMRDKWLVHTEKWENYCSTDPAVFTGEISSRRVKQLYYSFWRRFYLRPKYAFRTLNRISKSPSGFKKVIRGFLSFYKRFL